MCKRKKEINQPTNSKPRISAELAAFEAELGSYAPRPGRLNRDRTMFLAGRASVGSEITTTTNSKAAVRRSNIGFVAMTALSVCLLVALSLQQRTIIALQATAPTTVETTVTDPPNKNEANKNEANKNEYRSEKPDPQEAKQPPTHGILVDDTKRRRFDFSTERLLTLADSGNLSMRSFYTATGIQTKTKPKTEPLRDWPKQTYDPTDKPLPYYKLLRQYQ